MAVLFAQAGRTVHLFLLCEVNPVCLDAQTRLTNLSFNSGYRATSSTSIHVVAEIEREGNAWHHQHSGTFFFRATPETKLRDRRPGRQQGRFFPPGYVEVRRTVHLDRSDTGAGGRASA